jgi:LysM repeat protein
MVTTYKIKPGDNLSAIASKYGTTVKALQNANGISNPNLIYAGKQLTIPNASPTVTSGVVEGRPTPTGYKYEPFEYEDYAESDQVTALGTKKSEAEDAVANYGDFAWSQQGKYDKLIQDYESRPEFSYDFNADALYQQYKDKYIQQGKMAMADTIGQASALTGGYGNSYAVSAGSQAYQAHLEQLNDVIPELYSLAYDKYKQKGQDMLNAIALLGNEREFEYGKWGDKYNQLVSDRGYYGTQYDNERAMDYGMYSDDRNLDHNIHSDEQTYGYNSYRDTIEDAQWKAQFDEAQRQFNEQMAWEKKMYEDEMSAVPQTPAKNNTTKKKETSETEIKATKTDATSWFIANHQTKDEYMRRNKSYKQFQSYIDAEIAKAQDSLSDEELMYLKQYYGF